jgi:hypothetical protein
MAALLAGSNTMAWDTIPAALAAIRVEGEWITGPFYQHGPA